MGLAQGGGPTPRWRTNVVTSPDQNDNKTTAPGEISEATYYGLEGRVIRLEEFRGHHEKIHEDYRRDHEKVHGDYLRDHKENHEEHTREHEKYVAPKQWVYGTFIALLIGSGGLVLALVRAFA